MGAALAAAGAFARPVCFGDQRRAPADTKTAWFSSGSPRTWTSPGVA